MIDEFTVYGAIGRNVSITCQNIDTNMNGDDKFNSNIYCQHPNGFLISNSTKFQITTKMPLILAINNISINDYGFYECYTMANNNNNSIGTKNYRFELTGRPKIVLNVYHRNDLSMSNMHSIYWNVLSHSPIKTEQIIACLNRNICHHFTIEPIINMENCSHYCNIIISINFNLLQHYLNTKKLMKIYLQLSNRFGVSKSESYTIYRLPANCNLTDNDILPKYLEHFDEIRLYCTFITITMVVFIGLLACRRDKSSEFDPSSISLLISASASALRDWPNADQTLNDDNLNGKLVEEDFNETIMENIDQYSPISSARITSLSI